jgi:hypothetical protein
VLKQTNPQVLSALASLQGNASFETVRSWLQASLNDLHAENTLAKDDVVVRWNQGAAQVLTELLKKVETAPDVLRKSR